MSFLFKKLVIFNLIFCILIINSKIIYADDITETVDTKEIEKTIETASQTEELPKIDSRYAVVIDRNNRTILYGKNEMTKTKMASTTKIMTSLIVIEKSNLNDIVEISSKAAGTGGSRLKIKKGDKITVRLTIWFNVKVWKRCCRSFSRICGGKFRWFCRTYE